MILDIEKLRKARLAAGAVWTRMDTDNALAEDLLNASGILFNILLDLEETGECIIKKGGNDGANERTEAGSDTESSS